MYKGLTIDKILEEGSKDGRVRQYMPDERDIPRLPRQWLVNIIHTVMGDEFRGWVSELIKHRNDHVAEKKDLMIELDPAIAEAFRNSVNISSKSVTDVDVDD